MKKMSTRLGLNITTLFCGVPQDAVEYAECEAAVKNYPPFQEAMRKRGISDMDLVMVDPWYAVTAKSTQDFWCFSFFFHSNLDRCISKCSVAVFCTCDTHHVQNMCRTLLIMFCTCYAWDSH